MSGDQWRQPRLAGTTPAERYAERLANWRALERHRYRMALRKLDAGRSEDRGLFGLTYGERRAEEQRQENVRRRG